MLLSERIFWPFSPSEAVHSVCGLCVSLNKSTSYLKKKKKKNIPRTQRAQLPGAVQELVLKTGLSWECGRFEQLTPEELTLACTYL